MIRIVNVMEMDEVSGKAFVDMAKHSDRDGMNVVHAGFASNGYRIHVATEEGFECGCGNAAIHKTINDALDRYTHEIPFAFAIDRQLLLEALAGIPGGDYANEIYFHVADRNKPIVIASPNMERSAVIMPITVEIEKSLYIPRITEGKLAEDRAGLSHDMKEIVKFVKTCTIVGPAGLQRKFRITFMAAMDALNELSMLGLIRKSADGDNRYDVIKKEGETSNETV